MCMDVPFIQERTTNEAVGAQYFLCGRSIRLIMTHLGIGESQWTPLLNCRHHLPFAKWKAFWSCVGVRDSPSVTHREQALFRAVSALTRAPVHHVVYKVKMKQQAVWSPPPRASPLTLGFMARAMLQVAVLADQEFRNYSMMLIDGQIAPRLSLFAFGCFQTWTAKGMFTAEILCLFASWWGIAPLWDLRSLRTIWLSEEMMKKMIIPAAQLTNQIGFWCSKAYADCGGGTCLWYLLSFIKVLDSNYFQINGSWMNGWV